MPSRLLLQQLPPPPPPLPVAADENNNHHPHRRGVLLAATIGSAAAATCVLLLLVAVLLFLRRRYWRRRPTLPFSPPPAPARPLRRYSRRALRRATAGFHPSRLLGRGAASPVYLATFPPGNSSSPSLAAVKTRASPHELHLLASLPDSPRVVSLLGYSSSSSGGGGGEQSSLSLVFEYMAQGSLQAALFGERVLDWRRRVGVIRDVARALAFLHGECAPPVVHGDLKPSNVLLDADFRAKLADFGLARFKTPDVLPVADNDFMSQELGGLDQLSTAASAANGGGRQDNGNKEESSSWGKEWWWKQDGSGELDSKDYVAEWIGTQIGCPERNPDWADDAINDHNKDEHAASPSPEQNADGKGNNDKKEMGQMREWWKEEFFEEMSKKAGGSFDKRRHHLRATKPPWLRSVSLNNNDDDGNGVDLSSFRRSRKRSRRQRGRSAGAGSDATNNNADLLSRELSSTTSMRGTVCYVAPECGGAGGDHDLLEKSDIYSFGVLVLVILSGRRPLHILSSPMKLERANLVGWCRQLAKAGNVLDIVDERLLDGDGYDRDQAAMCVHLALLCLQRQPELRPDSADIVKMLDGEMELPHPPPVVENSPSPRVRPFPRSSRRPAQHQHTDAAANAAAGE